MKMLSLIVTALLSTAAAAPLAVQADQKVGGSLVDVLHYQGLYTESGWMNVVFEVPVTTDLASELTIKTMGLPEGVTVEATSYERQGDKVVVRVLVERTEAAKMMNVNHMATLQLMSGDMTVAQGEVQVWGADYTGR